MKRKTETAKERKRFRKVREQGEKANWISESFSIGRILLNPCRSESQKRKPQEATVGPTPLSQNIEHDSALIEIHMQIY